MTELYILEGNKTVECKDLLTWGQWLEKADRHVADVSFGDIRISTIFLGLDHQFGDGPPLLFETLVFGGPLDQEMERFSTWEEAKKGHKEMVKRVKKEIK